MKKIYCLFSVANDYDQPRNNLVALWGEKPDFETFCKLFEITIEPGANILAVLDKYGDALIKLREVYNGRETLVFGDNYRLEVVTEGTKLAD